MTWTSRILSFFPAFQGISSIALVIAGLVSLAQNDPAGGLIYVLGSLACLYLLPPLLYRLHNWIYPLREGFSRIDSFGENPTYNPWWGSHQLQGLYIALPELESLLRLFPGVYSAWLRLWGAKVGRGVYWTPRVEIIDRPLVSVGDHVVFGHRSALCSHVIIRKKDGLRLYVKTIQVGSGCLVGADSNLGPGVRVSAGTDLPYATEGRINQIFENELANE